MDEQRQQRLAAVSLIAVGVESETGVPAAAIVAQWAAESNWGAKPVGRANYFGIKHSSRDAKFCVVTTHEWFTESEIGNWNHRYPDRPARKTGKVRGAKFEVALDDLFADYDSLEASVRDYAWLISHGDSYRLAWAGYSADRDLAGLIVGIANVYSTSPSYAELVAAIAGQANVRVAIASARTRSAE